MRQAGFDSASGLRPASAFIVIACVLSFVGVWVSRTVLAGESQRSAWERAESTPEPEYSILDRDGRPLALFVQQLDLVMSPNAMWQGHTPVRMAERLGRLLAIDPGQLLTQMLPDARDGIIEVACDLDETQAQRVQSWVEFGQLGGERTPPIQGLWVHWSPTRNAFRINWAPEVTLSAETRAPHGCEESPLRWSRYLADGLAQCLEGEQHERGLPAADLEQRRRWVWDLLMPSTFTEVTENIPAEHGPALLALLDAEAVAHHQMSVRRGRDRQYPAGEMPLLGGWGYLDRVAAESVVLEQCGFAGAGAGSFERYRSMLPDEERGRLDLQLAEVLEQPRPLIGLERACDELLDSDGWNEFLDRRPASYSYLRHRAVRQRARSYFLDSVPASESPRVVTTLDLSLQNYVGHVLDGLMETHGPALAMAIVVEVATGDVLAVESREAYGYDGFAPLYHVFTPGSTFKPLVMAAALEAGVVHPEEVFDVGESRAFQLGRGRVIHEAESSRTGLLTASECLAHSVNAGMVQIGLRVSDKGLREVFDALGYGRQPGTGLGGERGGFLARLPWSETQTKASVCFGHELSVTLWQHAAGLTALVRGGEAIPLRMLRAVEQNDVRYDLEPPRGEPVFSFDTSLNVREMMKLGAREGTGARVAAPEVLPGIIAGTKTGTPEKVGTEACMHVELAHYQRHREEQTPCSRTCRRTIVTEERPHQTCYCPSMCIFGRLEGTDRELLVMVVADDPRVGKFGGDVAGPAAVAILREALGQTRRGKLPVPDLVEGFAPSKLESERPRGGAQPWAEVGW